MSISRINGFRPVKHITGAPYNGQATLYAVGTGANVFVGDAVKLATGSDAAGINFVTPLAAGTAGTGQATIGFVLAIIPAKMDPVSGKMTAGAIALDAPQFIASAVGGYVLVADSPDIVAEVEVSSAGSSYSFALADVGKNINVFAGVGSQVTGTSLFTADGADKGTAATLPFRILGVVNRVDNDKTGAFTRVLVTPNNHQLKGGTGAAGV